MRERLQWFAPALLVLGFLTLASPTSVSAINTCPTNCHCQASCTATCLVGQVPEVEQITCEEYGVCIGAAGCSSNPNCPALACTTTINGTSGGDTLNGGSAHECINGLGGNDTIDGNAGDDTILAGAGTDTVYGDSGNDCLYGEGDGDNLDGESGTDLADGGTGTDTCTAETVVSCP